MTYMDNVEVIVEEEKYARDGVHKGMQGWITEPENINGYWLVNFPQCGEKNDIATIPVREGDMKVVKILDARVKSGSRCNLKKKPIRQNHLPKSRMIFLIIVFDRIKTSCLLR